MICEELLAVNRKIEALLREQVLVQTGWKDHPHVEAVMDALGYDVEADWDVRSVRVIRTELHCGTVFAYVDTTAVHCETPARRDRIHIRFAASIRLQDQGEEVCSVELLAAIDNRDAPRGESRRIALDRQVKEMG